MREDQYRDARVIKASLRRGCARPLDPNLSGDTSEADISQQTKESTNVGDDEPSSRGEKER